MTKFEEFFDETILENDDDEKCAKDNRNEIAKG